MKISIRAQLQRLSALLLLGVCLYGQSAPFARITPEKATLLVGESRRFRLIDQDGHMLKDPTWIVPDADALQPQMGDELVIVAKTAGRYTIRALSSAGSAEASIEVMEGAALPMGTVKWSGPAVEGCTTGKITPAVPSASGVDVFVQSRCQDGEYISAYTADGIEVWRRRIGQDMTAPLPVQTKSQAVVSAANSKPWDFHSASICDSVSAGTTQQKIQDLLNQRKLTFRETGAGERVWVVDESNSQCKLWFDEKAVLTRKQKILVNE